jgi:hypothetical protein
MAFGTKADALSKIAATTATSVHVGNMMPRLVTSLVAQIRFFKKTMVEG